MAQVKHKSAGVAQAGRRRGRRAFGLLLAAMVLTLAGSVLLPSRALAVKIYDLSIQYLVEGTDTQLYPVFEATLPEGTPYSWPLPAIQNYELANPEQYEVNDYGQSLVSGTLTGDTTIEVFYLPEKNTATYTVNHITMNPDGSHMQVYESVQATAKVNTTVQVSTMSIPGYSWSISDVLLDVTADGLATKNLYYIKTERRVVAVHTGTGWAKTIVANPGDDVTDQVKEVLETEPERLGYTFVRWDDELEPQSDGRYLMPAEDTVINAIWDAHTTAPYTVEFYFEPAENEDKTKLENYVKRGDMDAVRYGQVGTLTDHEWVEGPNGTPADKDELIAQPDILFAKNATKSRYPTVYGSDLQSYVTDCPFYGFDFYTDEQEFVQLDGSGVLKLYYSREEWELQIWDLPWGTGKTGTTYSQTPGNSLWHQEGGNYYSLLSKKYPTQVKLKEYFERGELYVSWVTNKTSGAREYCNTARLMPSENDPAQGTFTITVPHFTVTGTYTKDGNNLTLKPGKVSPLLYPDNSQATFGKATVTTSELAFELTITYTDENSQLVTLETQSYKLSPGHYAGLVEQNRANTIVNSTQTKTYLKTEQDIVDKTVRMYPLLVENQTSYRCSTIYAMPLGATQACTDKELLHSRQLWQKDAFYSVTGQMAGKHYGQRYTIGASAFRGCSLDGGYYRVGTTPKERDAADWQPLTKLDAGASYLTTDCRASITTSDDGATVLQVGANDQPVYIDFQLPLVWNRLGFMDMHHSDQPLTAEAFGKSGTGTYIEPVQYTQSLDFLLTDKYKLTDPTGQMEFVGWYWDADLTEPIQKGDTNIEKVDDPPSRHTNPQDAPTWEVYAKWKLRKATITFETMGGTPVDPQVCDIGDTGQRPADPTKEGFTFVGWYVIGRDAADEPDEPQSENLYDFDELAQREYRFLSQLKGDITLYAKWKPVNAVEYTVRHVLLRKNTDTGAMEEVLLEHYTQKGMGTLGETITAWALDSSCVTLQEASSPTCYYIAIEEDPGASKSLLLTEDPEKNVVTFKYHEADTWAYRVHYLTRSGLYLYPTADGTGRETSEEPRPAESSAGDAAAYATGGAASAGDGSGTDASAFQNPKTVAKTHLLYATESAREIPGWKMIKGNGKKGVGTNVYGQQGAGYVSAYLSATGGNELYIYYDKERVLSFDLQGAPEPSEDEALYANRSLIWQEKTTLPKGPAYEGHVFLGWNTKSDGSGDSYAPGETFTMPDDDVKLYAEWAEATVQAAPGRLLDPLTTGKTDVKLAKDGTCTVLFSVTTEGSTHINPNSLKLVASETFPAGTVMTLIDCPVDNTRSPRYYYRRLTSDTDAVPLTSFVRMGSQSEAFSTSHKEQKLLCQICVEYPEGSELKADKLWLTTSKERPEAATTISVRFGDALTTPVGSVALSGESVELGTASATVTVSGVGQLAADQFADQSDRRHTHGTLTGYAPVLLVSLQDKNGHMVPFPEDSAVQVGSVAKNAGRVSGALTLRASDGSYALSATGLPSDEPVTLCVRLCAADGTNVASDSAVADGGAAGGSTANLEHPDRLVLGEATMELPSVQTPEYAVRATLRDGDLSRVFTVPANDVALTFDVAYTPADAPEAPSVSLWHKTGKAAYEELSGWQTTVEKSSDGKAVATVTVPAGTAAGTYRVTFSAGQALFHYNLIVTED